MSDVKRYIPEGYTQPASRSGTGTHMVESRDGDYVLASDYDALAQRCRELEGRADALSQELQAALSDWNSLVRAIQSPTHGGAVGHAAAVVRERNTLRAEVERLNLHVEKAQQHALTMGNKAIDLAGREIDLRAEVEALREIREIASQCAANGGYLCSADLIELRELLRR